MRRWAVGGLVVGTQTVGGCDDYFVHDPVPLAQSIPVAVLLLGAWATLAVLGARWYWRRSRRWPSPRGAVGQRVLALLWPVGTMAAGVGLVVVLTWEVAFDYRRTHRALFTWGGLVVLTAIAAVIILLGVGLAIFLAVGIWRRRRAQLIVVVVLAAWSLAAVPALVRGEGDLWVRVWWAAAIITGVAAATLLPGSLTGGDALPLPPPLPGGGGLAAVLPPPPAGSTSPTPPGLGEGPPPSRVATSTEATGPPEGPPPWWRDEPGGPPP